MGGAAWMVIGFISVVTPAAAWVGAGVYAGMRAEDGLREMVRAPQPGQVFRLERLEHRRGLLESSGSVDLVWRPACSAGPGEAPLALRLDYLMSHLPQPDSVFRVRWRAAPAGGARTALAGMVDAETPLRGEGRMRFDGVWSSAMSLPALADAHGLRLSPSTGWLRIDGKAMVFRWSFARVAVPAAGDGLDIRDVAIDLDLHNRYLGTGRFDLKVGSVGAGFGTIEGLGLRSEAIERGDRLDLSLAPSVRSLRVGEVTLSDLAIEAGISGIDARSVETLTTVHEASCGFDSMTPEQAASSREALTTLLLRGFTASIRRLEGSAKAGSVQGRLDVEIAQAGGRMPELARQLRVSGQLTLRGDVLSADQRAAVVGTGFAVEDNGAVRTTLDYAEGRVRVNGRSQDVDMVRQVLVAADARIQAALAGIGRPVPVGAPPREGAGGD